MVPENDPRKWPTVLTGVLQALLIGLSTQGLIKTLGSMVIFNENQGEINMFLDCFQLILMGFLTTSLHKNSQNDVKLLET